MYISVNRYILQSLNAESTLFHELILADAPILPTRSALILASASAFSSSVSQEVLTGQFGKMKTTMMETKTVSAPSTAVKDERLDTNRISYGAH
jgi:hypothetical protein